MKLHAATCLFALHLCTTFQAAHPQREANPFAAACKIHQTISSNKSNVELNHTGAVLTERWTLTATHVFRTYLIAKNDDTLTSLVLTVNGVPVDVANVYHHPDDAAAVAAASKDKFSPPMDATLIESQDGAFGGLWFSLVVDIIPQEVKDACYAVGSVNGETAWQRVVVVEGVAGCSEFVGDYKAFGDDEFRGVEGGGGDVRPHHVCTKVTEADEESLAESGGPLVCKLSGAGALCFGVGHVTTHARADFDATFVFPGALQAWIVDTTGAPAFTDIESRALRSRLAQRAAVVWLVLAVLCSHT